MKCGYCDFNAYAGMDGLKDAYAAAMVAEIHKNAPLLAGREIVSIGFGGGTPSEVAPAHIAAVIAAIREHAGTFAPAEITLEANPGTLDDSLFDELRQAGVTRLSIGAQSFHAHELRFLDRIHTPRATSAAVELARRAGFQHIGLDLIYGLPDQSLAEWMASLNAAIELNTDHVSCYALTVEDGTLLGRRVREGKVTPIDPDLAADMYEAAAASLGDAGFEHYEISNWARSGGRSRHNMTYWTDGEYLAIGAGAHGYLTGDRYENIAHPRAYIAAVQANPGPRPALSAIHSLPRHIQIADWISLRLRMLNGFAASSFRDRFNADLSALLGPPLQELAEAGVLDVGETVRLTRRGVLLHGEVSARLLAYLQAAALPPVR
jgi:oxygen-independent coproporphyrinogen-3 oxidase